MNHIDAERRAYRATSKQASSHVVATLDILTTILGISRYGYRYCTLHVSSPSLGEGKTRQGGGEGEREVRYAPRYVCLEVVSHE